MSFQSVVRGIRSRPWADAEIATMKKELWSNSDVATTRRELSQLRDIVVAQQEQLTRQQAQLNAIGQSVDELHRHLTTQTVEHDSPLSVKSSSPTSDKDVLRQRHLLSTARTHLDSIHRLIFGKSSQPASQVSLEQSSSKPAPVAKLLNEALQPAQFVDATDGLEFKDVSLPSIDRTNRHNARATTKATDREDTGISASPLDWCEFLSPMSSQASQPGHSISHAISTQHQAHDIISSGTVHQIANETVHHTANGSVDHTASGAASSTRGASCCARAASADAPEDKRDNPRAAVLAEDA